MLMVEARLAEFPLGVGPSDKTTAAEGRAARGTFTGAARADVAVASRTADRALATQRGVTPLTPAVVVAGHSPATVPAVHSVPGVEGYVGAFGVVRLEDLTDEGKEVQEAALGQCRLDRRRPVPFAESLGADVGMRDIAVSLRGAGLGGDHLIRILDADQVPPQRDPKASKVGLQIWQMNWTRAAVPEFAGSMESWTRRPFRDEIPSNSCVLPSGRIQTTEQAR
jgi:hypothetical protein